jgi:hypothetical protein
VKCLSKVSTTLLVSCLSLVTLLYFSRFTSISEYLVPSIAKADSNKKFLSLRLKGWLVSSGWNPTKSISAMLLAAITANDPTARWSSDQKNNCLPFCLFVFLFFSKEGTYMYMFRFLFKYASCTSSQQVPLSLVLVKSVLYVNQARALVGPIWTSK